MATTTSDIAAELAQKLRDRKAVVGVIGLGYVGLPLLDAYFRAGFATIGFDVDAAKVQQLNRGQSYIAHIPAAKIAGWLEARRFRATADMADLQ